VYSGGFLSYATQASDHRLRWWSVERRRLLSWSEVRVRCRAVPYPCPDVTPGNPYELNLLILKWDNCCRVDSNLYREARFVKHFQVL